MMQCVKHVVLSGGALKGIAFLGSLECLQRHQSLSIVNLETLAGSSVGAIIASLLCIGYTTSQLFKVAAEVDFGKLADPDLAKLLRPNFGLDSGHRIVATLRDLFHRKGVNPDVTMDQLFKFTGQRLVITVSCVGKGVRYFDYESEPDLAVISAIRMSISIPLVFTAVKYKGDYYVDGGLLDNVPLKVLADQPAHTIVIIRTEMSAYQQPTPETDTAGAYLWGMWKTVMKEMERLRMGESQNRLHKLCAIKVPSADLKTSTEIALTLKDKQSMLRAGYKAALRYLQSEAWLAIRVYALPYKAMRNVWHQDHKEHFSNTIEELKQHHNP
jgi:predicted acylesterase/phospholipase RssA